LEGFVLLVKDAWAVARIYTLQAGPCEKIIEFSKVARNCRIPTFVGHSVSTFSGD